MMTQQQFIGACNTGDIETLEKCLLSGNVDINQANDDGYTPLHCACWGGHEAVVTLLLQQGADINQAANYGETPLHRACWKGHDVSGRTPGHRSGYGTRVRIETRVEPTGSVR